MEVAYHFGETRQNVDTKVVAIRTAYPADGAMAWLVCDPRLAPSGGGHYAPTREIEKVDWADMAAIVDVS